MDDWLRSSNKLINTKTRLFAYLRQIQAVRFGSVNGLLEVEDLNAVNIVEKREFETYRYCCSTIALRFACRF